MMEPHPSEKARIPENERPSCLLKDEVIVLLGTERSWFGPQSAAHPEVQTEPSVAGELEEHLFTAGHRADEAGSRQLATQFTRIAAAEDALPRMHLHGEDLPIQPSVPLLPIVFDLRQFGHRGSYTFAAALSPHRAAC